MVSASDLGPEGREFEPWPVESSSPGHGPRCVLRQNTLNSHSASLMGMGMMGTSKMLAGNL